jgi:hypothetical protein
MKTNWTSEGIWNAAFGSTETCASVLAEAYRQHITPQDYVRSCLVAAREQGADFDLDSAFGDLCRQLWVAVS